MAVTADIIDALCPGLNDAQLASMGRDAAFDAYLAFLSHHDVWAKTGLVFKGGTAVRKFLCDPEIFRRVSYDLDFTLRNPDTRERLPHLMSSTAPYMECEFRLELGRHSRVHLSAPFLPEQIGVGFDAAEGRVLQHPEQIELQRRPIHDHFDIDLSFKVPVMTVDETVAEKLTRWHHRPLIRDLYDLSMLRPLIADTASVARMWVIKGHRAFHNPNKGATTSAPAPADFDGIINVPSLRDLSLPDLQFDTPTADHAKRILVEEMLAEFSEAYAFCVEEIDDELEQWASDTRGEHIAAVEAAANDMAAQADDPLEHLFASKPMMALRHDISVAAHAGAANTEDPADGQDHSHDDIGSFLQSLGIDITASPGSAAPLPPQDEPVGVPQTRPCGAQTDDGTPCDNRVSPTSSKCSAGHTPLPRAT